ncbi:VOC family protein [Nocardia sp. NPDC049149]|uniref:VOC family protein n=1 Tax=Nocardia sp. NPDC049149 TaxID=3364315 RepID=UPI0037197E72
MDAIPAGSVVWVNIESTDVDAIKDFYGSLFGWTYIPIPAPGGRTDHLFTAPGAAFPMGHVEPSSSGAEYVALGTVSYDVPEDAARLKNLGAQVVVAPGKAADGGDYALMRDPRGNVFVIWTPPELPADAPPPDPSALAPKPGSAAWFEIGTRDIEATKSFYAEALGWRYELDLSVPGGPYWSVCTGTPLPAGGLRDLSGSPEAAEYSMHLFLTADISASARKAVSLGASIEQAPTGDGRSFARLRDPRGNRFGLFSPGTSTD